jgi:glycerophosphoryl diester phosphodiesterase
VPEEVSRAGGSLWCPYFSELTADDLARARELDLCVAVWTVNEPEDIDAMIDLGVDAIVTDYPGRVQRRLSDRGYRWAR